MLPALVAATATGVVLTQDALLVVGYRSARGIPQPASSAPLARRVALLGPVTSDATAAVMAPDDGPGTRLEFAVETMDTLVAVVVTAARRVLSLVHRLAPSTPLRQRLGELLWL